MTLSGEIELKVNSKEREVRWLSCISRGLGRGGREGEGERKRKSTGSKSQKNQKNQKNRKKNPKKKRENNRKTTGKNQSQILNLL